MEDPRDIKIRKLEAENARLTATIIELKSTIAELTEKIAKLTKNSSNSSPPVVGYCLAVEIAGPTKETQTRGSKGA